MTRGSWTRTAWCAQDRLGSRGGRGEGGAAAHTWRVRVQVRITGRYKEMIIGAGGENIAPVPIEDAIKVREAVCVCVGGGGATPRAQARCPAISNIIMVGDKRKYNIAIVTLKTVGATGELPGSETLDGPAAVLVPGVSTVQQAMDSAEYVKVIEAAIVAVNGDTSVVTNNTSKIAKFTILACDFSVSTGELTPTLKLKRATVEENNHAFIDTMYAPEAERSNYVRFGHVGAVAVRVDVV